MTHCRSCGSGHLHPILDLGSTPLANSLLTAEQLNQPEATYPLVLVYCSDCHLVQITETVPPDVLFSHYLYFSSFSTTMLQHAKTLAERLIAERSLNERSLVVEIASNDGYLLQNYVRASVPVLGIEPAANIVKVANDNGVRTLAQFFNQEVAIEVAQDGLADVIHANNVLAHVAELNSVVEGFCRLLKPQGVVIVEAPYVGDMIIHNEFDTIYHEHLCYFSLTALQGLFARHGLTIVDVERLPIHGGSLRIFAAHEGTLVGQRVTDLLHEEQTHGMTSFAFYQNFGQQVEAVKRELLALLHDLKAQGKAIAAYGASAKGATLLNTLGIGRDTLDFMVDRSTVKQGMFTPGTMLEILPPEALLERQPDYTLLLTWNFADEILQQQTDYRGKGGKFILPIPSVKVV